MKTRRPVAITGTGSCVPERVMTNFDFEKLVDTSDEWIAQRTGIRQRRMVADGQTTSDLCHTAAARALEVAGVRPEELDLIVVGTVSGDMPMPSTACFLQARLGAANAGAFDIQAACSGFVYGLSMASHLVASGAHHKVLVVGAEVLSRFLNYQDRTSCILFGDGAGAAVVQPAPAGSRSDVLHTHMGADGTQAEVLWIPAGGSRFPASAETVAARRHAIGLDGKAVYKFAVKKFVELIEGAARAVGVPVSELDFVIPHQVNLRIIESAAEKLGYPMERMMVNIDRYGNTSAASVPIALDEAVRTGKLKRGDLVVMVAFGAGLTWGSVAARW